MIYPNNFEHKIGFDEIRQIIKSYCLSTLGQERVEAMSFSNMPEIITFQLDCVREYCSIINEGTEFPINHYNDLRLPLVRIKPINTYLTEHELYELKRSLETFNAVLYIINIIEEGEEKASEENSEVVYKYPNLHLLGENKRAFTELTDAIEKIVDKFGKIRDAASPELHAIRRELESTERSISATIHSLLRKAQAEGYAEKESSPTMRDGRLVIPVIPASKRKIKGIVHDESATGKTIYIEPTEIVDANNRIRELQAAERREIIKILQAVAALIRPNIEELLEAYKLLGELDFIRAKSLWAIDSNAKFPAFKHETILTWHNAIHPLLDRSLKKHHKKVVPLDIALHNEQRIILISGPNAGGKSVCLKTVGLLQYMWQCGLPVPVHEDSVMGLFDNIFIDIGDEQSLENELSTYSSHLTNMKQMMKASNSQTLLLIDEFGGGTEPTIGGAMAEAILTRFVSLNCFGVITTHYQNLKLFADRYKQIVNGAMLYDRQQMAPLFVLEIGRPGSSFAIEIARKIGLPQEVIAQAQELVGNDYIQSEKYLQDIARDKRYWESKRQKIHQQEKQLDNLVLKHESDIKQLEAQRKSILAAAKDEAQKLLQESNAQIERTIREIREVQAEKERTKQLRTAFEAFKNEVEETNTGLTDEAILRKMEQIKQRKQRKEERKQKAQQQSQPKLTTPQTPPTLAQTQSATLGVGSPVRIKGQQVVGTIEDISKKDARVRFGMVLTTVKLSRLEPAQPVAQDKTFRVATFVSKETRDAIHEKKLNFRQDIDVRGMRANEALVAVSYYIDEAILVGVSRVRILHGTGTGALKETIRTFLASVPSVSDFRDEHVQFGGAGITVVDFS